MTPGIETIKEKKLVGRSFFSAGYKGNFLKTLCLILTK